MSDGARTSGRSTSVIALIIGREVRERMRARSFQVLTGLLVVIILAIGLIARLASGDDGREAIDVGIVGEVPAAFEDGLAPAGELLDRPVEVTSFADAGAARRALGDGDVDVVVDGTQRRILFADTAVDRTEAVVQQAWATAEVQERLADAGLGADEVRDVLTADPLEVTTLDADDGEDESGLAVLTGTVAAILLFISLQTFGTYVLTGVVEEKASAVVEVLLARVRPDQLLAGKVIGIGIVALAQFTLAVAAGLASLAISGAEVPTPVWSAIPMTLVWFLGGYAFYSMLFALAGSLVSRQEDAQAASAPIMTALIGAYMLVFVLGYSPDTTASRVISVLPPIAPMLMPVRMASGAASVLEVVVALVLLAGATVLVWRGASRIYHQVLLQRGTRVSWRAAMAMLRHS